MSDVPFSCFKTDLWSTGSDPVYRSDTSASALGYFTGLQSGIAFPDVIPTGLTFDTAGTMSYGQIGNPTVTSTVQVTPVPNYGTVTPSDPNDITEAPWSRNGRYICYGVAGICFLGAGELVAAGYPIFGAAAEGAEEITTVSRWGQPGIDEGDWVMNGPANTWNYILSGKWQPGFGNEFAPFSSWQEADVLTSDLQWPPLNGWSAPLNIIKGILGQRIFLP